METTLMSEGSAYEKNTSAQYDALGRFVENFEMMVNDVREICIDQFAAGQAPPSIPLGISYALVLGRIRPGIAGILFAIKPTGSPDA
jgi:hypothetical protein